jgi:molybdopterin-biosynthesis enzyme MoeA-like protein
VSSKLDEMIRNAKSKPTQVDMSFLAGDGPAPSEANESEPVAEVDEAAFENNLEQIDDQEELPEEDSDRPARQPAGASPAQNRVTTLPQDGFYVEGVKIQPITRGMPEEVQQKLRSVLRTAAIRELSVGAGEAQRYSQRISQSALVVAALMAYFDVSLVADNATALAASLFRSQNPLLGSVSARLEALEEQERSQSQQLQVLTDQITDVRQTGAVVEQAVAFQIADRVENLTRGNHNVQGVHVTDKSAVYVRDQARSATKKRAEVEKDQAGRPLR